MQSFAIQASAYYSTSYDDVRYIDKGIFLVDQRGFIKDLIERSSDRYEDIRKKLLRDGCLRVLGDDELILPGFIDLHNHAPQWPHAGVALDEPLEVWLSKYTFPLESSFKDLDFANMVYEDLIKTSLGFGTTTALYFASMDKEPSKLLANKVLAMGQRGLVGKVCMDDPEGNPDYCRDKSADKALSDTEDFINYVHSLKDDSIQGVYPVITPRFIPSCTDEVLRGLGDLAKKYKDIHIQSHVSESDWEHGFAIDRFNKHDSFALDDFGLITDRTILAHGVHLSSEDMELLAKKGASIAHCPLSNVYFANGVFPAKKAKNMGLNVGLATDISGGYSPSMYSAIRQAVISSRMLEEGVDPDKDSKNRGRKDSQLSLNNAFYLATVGGGEALKLPIGKLEKGYAFDIQVVDLGHNIPRFLKEDKEIDLLHKVLLLSESSNIKEVYVQGQRIGK